MARLSRANLRGGRIIDIPSIELIRGRVPSINGGDRLLQELFPVCVTRTLKYRVLVERLMGYVHSGSGSILEITLDYFTAHNDYEFYMEQVLSAAFQSPELAMDFAMNLKLITLLKNHGIAIKRTMFVKVQKCFESLKSITNDVTKMMENRSLIRNLCDLIGQLYYRFRVSLDKQERYTVFELPTIECMKYLLKINRKEELIVLVKIMIKNYVVLSENHCLELEMIALEIRNCIAIQRQESVRENNHLLLFALDLINYKGPEFPDNLLMYYRVKFGPQWDQFSTFKSQKMLADVPSEILNNCLDDFNLTKEEYKNEYYKLC